MNKINTFNEEERDNMYEHFFYSMRKWLNYHSIYNYYNDLTLYYSFDQNKFLKRHIKNKNYTNNWLEIPIDKNLFYYFKQNMKILVKDDLHIMEGRKIAPSKIYVKDLTYVRYMKFVKKTFTTFFNKNKNYKHENFEIEKSKKLW